jgi:thiol-disulfide isomerase/thioredoxin
MMINHHIAMEGTMFKKALFIFCLVCLGVVGLTPAPANAEDTTKKIYQLALALHKDNKKLENFTYWIGGNIGEPLIDSGYENDIKLGKPLPDFILPALVGTEKIDSTQLEGPYILNFWASWCPPCREEFPVIVEAITDKTLSAPVFFINVFDSLREARSFARDFTALTFVVDTSDKLANQLGVTAIPTTIVVDEEGNVVLVHIGNLTEAGTAFLGAVIDNPGVGKFDNKRPGRMPK